MPNISIFSKDTQVESPSDVEKCVNACKEKFNQILSSILDTKDQEAHKAEEAIFKQLMQIGLLILKTYFANQNQGDYGETIETTKGTAKRGRTSEKSYFSIFGKLKVSRYLYSLGDETFAPLDIVLNLPKRCYSYFLSEIVNLLNINRAYEETVKFLKKIFDLTLSVSASETISGEGSLVYENYYDTKHDDSKYAPTRPLDEKGLTVVSFDGKGVPMIKKEAEKIKARQGKGEKRQKKKEALVGVKYNINANIRTPEEVAANLVFPEKREDNKETKKQEKAQGIRYTASVEKPKREVMKEIKEEVKDEDFSKTPLVCVMDGAKCLWTALKDVFKEIKDKVLILDIIHVLEYLWLIAHVKYKEGSDEAIQYSYEKLLLILQGKVASYIMELQSEMLSGHWKESQKKTFQKVITYFKNHKDYMKYDQYLARGHPISSGVVESACSHVVRDRMEISGARWGISGAETILKLRSVSKSNDWDKYWEFYTAQIKINDFLPESVKPLIGQEAVNA